MKKIIICFIILFLISGCMNKEKEEIKINSIDTDTVYSMIEDENIYIVDVREEYEYNGGHIKNAYNIPLSDIQNNKIFLPLDSTIIVYCRSGNRSKQAAELLIEIGYTSIYDMGGLDKWNYELVS